MKKTTAVILTAALLGGGALAVMADSDRYGRGGDYGRYCANEHGFPGRGHHGHERGGFGFGGDSDHRAAKMERHLGLDAQQTEKVRAIGQRYEKEFDALRAKMWDNRKQLRDLMGKEGVSDEDTRKLADVQGKLQSDAMVLRNRMQREIDQVLTPEQRAKHRSLREQFGRRHS